LEGRLEIGGRRESQVDRKAEPEGDRRRESKIDQKVVQVGSSEGASWRRTERQPENLATMRVGG